MKAIIVIDVGDCINVEPCKADVYVRFPFQTNGWVREYSNVSLKQIGDIKDDCKMIWDIKAIKDARLLQKMTINELSDLSGVNMKTISLIEEHKCNPTLRTLEKLAKALGMELCVELIREKQNEIHSNS